MDKNDDLLEKDNTIWDKVSADIKKEFDSEPVYKKKYLKNKIKSHDDKEISKVDSSHTCLAVISLDSTLNKDGNCYPQTLLKECKFILKKFIRHIIDHIENSSDDFDEE